MSHHGHTTLPNAIDDKLNLWALKETNLQDVEDCLKQNIVQKPEVKENDLQPEHTSKHE